MAPRFWVGGTGAWDASTTTHWAATTGGAGGQTVPGSADTVTFDGASGGGVVTVNFGGTITVQSIACGAFTGTLDFSANNNSVTLSAIGGMNLSGAGIRTINLGNGTWTISAAVGAWTATTVTNLTFNANSSTITFTDTSAAGGKTFASGGRTYNNVSFAAGSTGNIISITGSPTIATLTIAAPNYFQVQGGATITVTSLIATGSSGSPILFKSNSMGTAMIISSSSNQSWSWLGLVDVQCSGGGTFTATNSLDFTGNSGITITAPSAGAGTSPVGRLISAQRGTPY